MDIHEDRVTEFQRLHSAGCNLWDGAEYDVPHTTSSAHIGF